MDLERNEIIARWKIHHKSGKYYGLRDPPRQIKESMHGSFPGGT